MRGYRLGNDVGEEMDLDHLLPLEEEAAMSEEMKSSLEGLGYGMRLILEANCATVLGCLASIAILCALCLVFG